MGGVRSIPYGRPAAQSAGVPQTLAELIALVELNPKAYEEISRFDQPDRSRARAWPHPVVSNGILYIRDQDILLAFDLRK